eukprot:Amastigsp_a339765_5.p2 type:complete len:213 gc:universal Amastigsp_a339765_5:1607-969(-)
MGRFRYYVGFCLGEGAVIASGLGFNGLDTTGRPRWDRALHVRIVAIETAQTFKNALDNWNIGVARWLKLYVYARVATVLGGGFLAVLATNLMGAFWHGFYPGYYVSFVLGSFCTETARLCRRKLRPRVLGSPLAKTAYDIAGWALCVAFMAFGSVPFAILQLDRALYVWKQLCFFAPVAIVVAIPVLLALPTPRTSDGGRVSGSARSKSHTE